MNNYPLPSELLPHEEPILFIDKIIGFKFNKYLIAQKYIGKDNPFFKGHFPNYPILPGVILVEALFQACSLFNRLEMRNHVTNNFTNDLKKNNTGRAIKIENFIFKEEIRPDTKIELKVELKSRIMNFSVFKGEIFTDNKLIAKGEITTYIQKNKT